MLKDALRHSLRLLAETDEVPAWLDCLTLEIEDDAVRVVFPHTYFASYFAPCREHFEQALRQTLPAGPFSIHYDVRSDGGKAATPFSDSREIAAQSLPLGGTAESFASFFHNSKNALSVNAMRLMAHGTTAPGVLLLYGASGTGKSHLLHALHHEAFRAGQRVCSFSLARQDNIRFPWEYTPENFWQGCDLLLLDDLQDILNSPQRCRSLGACMDVAARAGKRLSLVMTGSRRHLDAAPAGLRTRLEAGLLLELLPPDVDVRLRYVQQRCRESRLGLSSPVMLRLAGSCEHVRSLQGILHKLRALTALKGHPLSEQELEPLLHDLAGTVRQDHKDIMEAVAQQYGFHADDLISGRRHPKLVLARQIAMYICRRNLGLSYPELGRAFGGKDHSTVIHAVKKIEKIIVNDKTVRQIIASIAATVTR